MHNYEVDFTYFSPEFSDIIVQANNPEHAKEEALEQIKENFPGVINIVIGEVIEV
jgi:hypothetical protein